MRAATLGQAAPVAIRTRPVTSNQPVSPLHADVLALQRTAGNRAVAGAIGATGRPRARPRFVFDAVVQRDCGGANGKDCGCGSCVSGLENDEDDEREQPSPAQAVQTMQTVPVQRSMVDEFSGGCGLCVDPMTAGIEAHRLVSNAFRRTGAFRLTDIPIVGPVAGDDTPNPFTPRPDLVALTPPNRIDFAELKPPLSTLKGIEQAAKYRALIKQRFPTMDVRGMTSSPITGPIPFDNPHMPKCAKQQLIVAPTTPGLLIYGCQPTRKELHAADPENCGCRKKKEEEKKKEEVPEFHTPPVPSPDALREMFEILRNLLKRQPRLVPQPAQPPIFLPKFHPCPFTDQISRDLLCKEPNGPTASFCVPRGEAEALGVLPPSGETAGPAAVAGLEGAPIGGIEPGLPVGPAVDQAELEGLKKGDGLDFGTTDRKPRVEKLQQRLLAFGGELTPDGMFGSGTAGELHRFQARSGLPESNVVDENCAAALTDEPDEASRISRLEGLKLNDGLVFGTFDRRPRVRELQTALTSRQFPCAVDGMFGPKTLGSLNGFQDSKDIARTEEVTPETANALEDRAVPGEGECRPGSVLAIITDPEYSPTRLE